MYTEQGFLCSAINLPSQLFLTPADIKMNLHFPTMYLWFSNACPTDVKCPYLEFTSHAVVFSLLSNLIFYFSNINLSIFDMNHLHTHLCVWLTQFSFFKILSGLHLLPLIRMFTSLQSPPQYLLFSIIPSQKDLISFELMVPVESALD